MGRGIAVHDGHDRVHLSRKGLAGRSGYELTDQGRRIAVFFTKTYTRIVELDPNFPDEIARRSPLARRWRDFERNLDQRINHAAHAA